MFVGARPKAAQKQRLRRDYVVVYRVLSSHIRRTDDNRASPGNPEERWTLYDTSCSYRTHVSGLEFPSRIRSPDGRAKCTRADRMHETLFTHIVQSSNFGYRRQNFAEKIRTAGSPHEIPKLPSFNSTSINTSRQGCFGERAVAHETKSLARLQRSRLQLHELDLRLARLESSRKMPPRGFLVLIFLHARAYVREFNVRDDSSTSRAVAIDPTRESVEFAKIAISDGKTRIVDRAMKRNDRVGVRPLSFSL